MPEHVYVVSRCGEVVGVFKDPRDAEDLCYRMNKHTPDPEDYEYYVEEFEL